MLIIGRLYNSVQPAFIVGFGVILFTIGSWQLSHITLETSSTQMIVPLIITGAAFACLFVPLTTAALSKIERHLMADAAGLNSFVRQVGGSVGLTIFATMFTNYAIEAKAGLAAHLTMLRPEVAAHMAQIIGGLKAHGSRILATAQMLAGRILGGGMYEQATLLSFGRVFLFQGMLFLGVIPLLFLMRVPGLPRSVQCRDARRVIMATEAQPTNGTEPAKATVVAPVPRKKKAMRAYMILFGLTATALAVYFIHGYVTRNEVATDDAQVDADVVPISTRVGGVVLHMRVADNQRVDAGAVIAEIDDADYKLEAAAAQDELDVATAAS